MGKRLCNTVAVMAALTFGALTLAGCATKLRTGGVFGSASDDYPAPCPSFGGDGRAPAARLAPAADEAPGPDNPPPPAAPAPPAVPQAPDVEEVPLRPQDVEEVPLRPQDIVAIEPEPGRGRLSRFCEPPPCAPTPCVPNPCGADRYKCDQGYFGGGVSVYPGVGFFVEGGKLLCSSCSSATYAEMSMHYQDLTDDFNGINDANNAVFVAVNIGIKHVLRPQARVRGVLRAGLGWAHVSGWDRGKDNLDFGILDAIQNSWGVYAGVGLETDIMGGRVTMGPEFRVFATTSTSGSRSNVLPMILWHIDFNM